MTTIHHQLYEVLNDLITNVIYLHLYNKAEINDHKEPLYEQLY